jgi:hypothetical protein
VPASAPVLGRGRSRVPEVWTLTCCWPKPGVSQRENLHHWARSEASLNLPIQTVRVRPCQKADR